MRSTSLLLLLCLVVGPGLARPAPASTSPPDLVGWDEAVAQERAAFALLESDPDAAVQGYLDAAQRFETLASREGLARAWWRGARCRWFAGEILPIDRKPERLGYYEVALENASRGLESDPDCAECMLWKFIALGRVATNRGLVSGMRSASEMAELLDRGIALEPTHRDGRGNSTLGNLHYGSAIFYRVLPDWTWLGWVIGVRGDKERALDHARQALALHPDRLDYRVELGSQLLCLGSSEDQSERLQEGLRMLERLLDSEADSPRDERQLAAAEIMLESPRKACGFTGDDWLEIDAGSAAAAAGGE